MFGKVGYLALTLPVGRAALLTSKLVAAMLWYVYAMLLAVAILAVLVWVEPNSFYHIAAGLPIIGSLNMNITGYFAITIPVIVIMFFCSTLSNCAFAGRRVHGFAAGAVGLVYAAAGFWLMNIVGLRDIYFVQNEFTWQDAQGVVHIGTHGMHLPQVGLEFGRIHLAVTPWGSSLFIDIYQIGIAVVMAAVAVAATYYLLKRRIALR